MGSNVAGRQPLANGENPKVNFIEKLAENKSVTVALLLFGGILDAAVIIAILIYCWTFFKEKKVEDLCTEINIISTIGLLAFFVTSLANILLLQIPSLKRKNRQLDEVFNNYDNLQAGSSISLLIILLVLVMYSFVVKIQLQMVHKLDVLPEPAATFTSLFINYFPSFLGILIEHFENFNVILIAIYVGISLVILAIKIGTNWFIFSLLWDLMLSLGAGLTIRFLMRNGKYIKQLTKSVKSIVEKSYTQKAQTINKMPGELKETYYDVIEFIISVKDEENKGELIAKFIENEKKKLNEIAKLLEI